MHHWRFDAIGVPWEIETERPLDAAERAAVTAVIDRFDRAWSRFRADSTVTALARSGGTAPAPPDAVAMLDLYDELADATGGAVHPLVGDRLRALGYGPRLDPAPHADAAMPTASDGAPAGPVPPAAAASPALPAAPAASADWRGRLRWSADELGLTDPATIDVGALGKGRLVDLVFAALADVPGALVVDGSGDLRVRGRRVRVGLEHPYDPSKAIGVVAIEDAALCASATNRRAWGDGLHHVLDARTGEPVRTWAATWAIAPDAMLADAAATALFFDGGPRFAAEHGVAWVRMSTDGRVQRSPGCPAELFTRGAQDGATGAKMRKS